MAASSDKVRRTFLDFFAARGHEEVPSSPLVPQNDPTLLFANAGMNQFKDVFTGKATRDQRRATSSQKCVRAGGKHNDLENVGRTARHHTFFEMLGNFSFGDYGKEDAIAFAFDLLAGEYKIDRRRLVYTVHTSDDEARQLWKRIAGVGDDRVIALGDKDNFWAMGETGPCGPCSEIHYHQGDDIPCAEVVAGRSCLGPACDCDRWIELWNLVFMQFEQLADKTRRPLPRPSVDTGMGLERLCAVLEGKRSNYEADLFTTLIERVRQLSGGKVFVPNDYGEGSVSVSMRAIADHARAAAFLIADGVFPDKTGREYVLRRIMRRAIYHGSLIGIGTKFFDGLCVHVTERMAHVFPELGERRQVINSVAQQEEQRFRETLERGVKIFKEETSKIVGKVVPGALAFKLYDTYGFPFDLTRVVAARRGLDVDEAGFDANMEEQRNRGEFGGSGEVAVEAIFQEIAARPGIAPTTFVGYETTDGPGRVLALVKDGREEKTVAASDAQIAIVTTKTPFYGESGGQVGDAGVIKGPRGTMQVTDTRRPVPNLFVHIGRITEGQLGVDDDVTLAVDVDRRNAVRRNHSATHLLHFALRQVLGDHVSQKGSLVAPDRLRFDFSHHAPIAIDDRHKIEDLVNARVLRNLPAVTDVLPIIDAKKAGAMAFFGEKYGDTVRMLTMGESRELCGGTHVARTGDIGFFKITLESGVAQGVRRIEAVTGGGAAEFVRRLQGELSDSAGHLRSGTFEVASKIDRLISEARERDKEIDKLRAKLAAGGGQDLGSSAEKIAGHHLLVADVGTGDAKALRDTADRLRDKLNPGLVVLVGAEGEKVSLVCMVTKDADKKLHAGKITGSLCQAIGGKGGGRPDLGQGGGVKPAAWEQTLATWKQELRDLLAAGSTP